ncbi:probable inactive nicotinamidase At3g16190 [Telopea speciosissima]|uniref:probable inactive nicotinamidase At3g16190 n=1 Tax=Telopea speciosissima TaxID=54955 RepID=UPI001CC3436D|nr:probable inactive nicotinamidase At3g16190 [Telopea speciosissima]
MEEKWKTTALLVIDMQKDFILPNKFQLLPGGQAIIPNVIKAVEIARQRGIFIVWVVREHDPIGRDVELYRLHLYGKDKETTPVKKGSVGAELVDGLEIQEGDFKLVKTRFSSFFGTNLHSVLQRVGIDSLVVTGIQTPNCVRATVFEAVELDYPSISIITDATTAFTSEIHAANLLDMKNIGVATPTLKQWCESSP